MGEKTVQDLILERLTKIEGKIDELQAWRWKLVGISSAAGFLWGILFSVGIAYMKYVA